MEADDEDDWMPYDSLWIDQDLDFNGPPPDFELPPPPPLPHIKYSCDKYHEDDIHPNERLSIHDLETCDNNFLSSGTEFDHPLSSHLRSVSIIIIVSLIFVLVLCVSTYLFWRRRRKKKRLQYLWKDSYSFKDHQRENSSHPLIYDDFVHMACPKPINGQQQIHTSTFQCPRNELSSAELLSPDMYQMPATLRNGSLHSERIYEEVKDQSESLEEVVPFSTYNHLNHRENEDDARSSDIYNSVYPDCSSNATGWTTLQSRDSETYPLNNLARTSRVIRNYEPKSNGNGFFATLFSKGRKNNSATTANKYSSRGVNSSHYSVDNNVCTLRVRGGEHLRGGFHKNDITNSNAVGLDNFCTAARRGSQRRDQLFLPINTTMNNAYQVPSSSTLGRTTADRRLMPNPDDILPKEAWTDFTGDSWPLNEAANGNRQSHSCDSSNSSDKVMSTSSETVPPPDLYWNSQSSTESSNATPQR